jgi:HEAT repeat protein
MGWLTIDFDPLLCNNQISIKACFDGGCQEQPWAAFWIYNRPLMDPGQRLFVFLGEGKMETILRHKAEAGLVERALNGDVLAANTVFNYLSSTNPHLRQIMKETLHELQDDRLWRHLLRCLALQRWDDQLDCERRHDPEASARIDASICEAFVEDTSEADRELKLIVLREGMAHSDTRLRHAAAYLLGHRKDPRAIPILDEAIDEANSQWQLRAIRALAVLKHEHCGRPLIKALAKDRNVLHQAANRALQELDTAAASAYVEALNHPNRHIRWHAARGLGQIGDTRCVDVLVEGLYDDNRSVRWATARVLANLDRQAVPAILNVLIQHTLTEPLREAGFHALNSMPSIQTRERLKPLLLVLGGSSTSMQASAVANRLLEEW